MNGRMPKIAVIGGTYLDIAIKCSVIPQGGQSLQGSSLSYAVTGPGPRQAVQSAQCGCKVHLISKVGGGPFGLAARTNLEEYQVNTDYVYTAEAKNTGVVVTLVDATGKNASCVYDGANTALLVREIEQAEQIIAEADVCLIHGRLPQNAIVSAIRIAKMGGTKTILNPARPIESDKAGGNLPIEYFSVDIIIPNLYEAADITEQSTANIRTAKMIGSDLVARGVGVAVITMGKRGCVVVDRLAADHIPSFEVELVDKTGCGDAFAGALAAYCAVKDDIHKAVEFASAAGALTCTKFGSIESLPTKAEIIELLQKHS
jgi:ribokinase